MSKQKNTQSHPISTDVRLLPLPFYDMLVTLMKPSSLLAPQKGLAASTFTFNLSPSNVQEISRNRYAENGNIQHTVQIQLRFCLCDTSKEQPDCYPSSEFQVVVNNKEIQLPPPLPTRPGQPLKRPHLPLDITAQAKISPTASNKIIVRWKHDETKIFAASVYLVRKLDTKILMKRLRDKGIKPDDFTRDVIKEKFQMEESDNEIKTVNLRVSLACPLGKIRMNTPCRASTCTHLQCFDANNFLHMNEKKSTWKCPVCDQPALYENLLIDGYFLAVINSSKLESDENEILLHKDGSWSGLSKQAEVKREAATKLDNILEISSDEDEVVKPPVKKEEPIIKKEEESNKLAPKKSTSRTRLKAKIEVETPVRKRQPTRRPSTRSSAPKRARKDSTDDEMSLPPPPEYTALSNGHHLVNGSLQSHSVPSSIHSIDLTLDDD